MYKIFLDDERMPEDLAEGWIICRSSEEAKDLVVSKEKPPNFLALDFDLGGEDTALNFLRFLYDIYPQDIPDYSVHSSNPCGRMNIISFMETWWKVSNGFLPRG